MISAQRFSRSHNRLREEADRMEAAAPPCNPCAEKEKKA